MFVIVGYKDGENTFGNKPVGLWLKNTCEERKLALIALNALRHCR